MVEKKTVFETLSKIKCDIKKKGRFNYVSWTEAWKEVKKIYPDTNFHVYSNEKGFPAFISSKAHVGAFVKVGITINKIEHIEYYPVTDNYNKAIDVDSLNVFAINTAIQRAKVKAIAHHGLGLYVYEGEDLPEEL